MAVECISDEAFSKIKEEFLKPTVLKIYDLQADTKIATDASSYGLGAVLLQRRTKSCDWKPVAYASRSLSETECCYAQIEKEALAITWACEKFSMYVLGRRFLIHTDHKPLIPLLGSKQLDKLPPRILLFRLRLTRFDYSIEYTPGKTLYIPDTLSRALLKVTEVKTNLQSADRLMEISISNLPASTSKLEEYRRKQKGDPVCSAIIHYCHQGWPLRKKDLDPSFAPFWEHQADLTIGEGLLLYDNRIVVPAFLQRKS